MAVSDEYLQFVMDQLQGIGPLRAQKAFGQAVVFCDGVPFGYVIDDVLYFKVDEANKSDYDEAGVMAWVTSDKNGIGRSYAVPADVLENRDVLKAWAEKAVAVASRRAAGKRRSKTQPWARADAEDGAAEL
ncbi:hypothetical protein LCGC14_2455050 [marine sediment metagenome]|uniref:TfoX N-terminal domain-containing protein n=1 Tax=marine sediment metagenome TaxID=412755 RepID=A0A0F9E8T0_9ZZZZ